MRELMKRQGPTESLALGAFVLAVLYAIFLGSAPSALLGVGFTLIVLGALPRQVALAFLVGASAILLVQQRKRNWEGFADMSSGSVDVSSNPSPSVAIASAAVAAANAITKGVEKKEGFSENIPQKPMLPDNTDRKEPLELGKPYKLPNEQDDKGFHLDAGTTFLNAYKALKPDQIAAMTKDTQDLLATQKSLVGMLESFGPLMQDMNKITGFFGSK